MASTYDKASLVMIPSGIKEGKLFSQKPVNGDGDFTFSRSTAATRVNADGNIEKETQNLFTYSNDFSQWTFGGVTRTGGQSGYDGSNNAWLITATNVSGVNVNQIVNTSGVKTYSIYAKAGTTNWIRMSFNDTGVNSRVWFDLTNGVVGTIIGYVIDTEITSLGSGWYRCSISVNLSVNSPSLYLFVVDGNGVTSASVGDSVYIQDAQLEQSLVARDYIETTTAAVEGGITDNVPRLDYTDSSCPALLLEPQRSNLMDYSEYVSGNSSASTPTLVENYAISPEGLQNAFQISTDAGAFRRVRKILTGLSGNTSYSMSVFVKKATSAVSTYGGLGMVWQGGSQKVNYIIFDEYNGTMSILQDQTSNTATKVDDVGDYWRFSVSATDTGTNTSFEAAYYACLSSTGSTIGTGVKSWVGYGLQVEAGSYATSYIPTYGTSVTRNDDSCVATSVEDLIGQTEGTMYWEGSIPTADQNTNVCQFNNSTTSSVGLEKRSNGKIRARVYNSGSAIVSIQSNSYGDENLKIAFAYKSGDMVLYINGTQIATDSTAFTFAQSLTEFQLGVGSLYFAYPRTSKAKQSLLFKTRLSNEELAALTTI